MQDEITFSALSVEPMNEAKVSYDAEVHGVHAFSALSVEPMNEAQRQALQGVIDDVLSVLSLLSR